MATEIKLPRLGQGMESGTIVKWLKSEGDQVHKGEPLYELDTDKVTQEVEADASGVLLKIAVAEGEVPVGSTDADGRSARGRGRAALVDAQDDRAPPHGGLAGAGLPARHHRRHGSRARSAQAPRRAQRRQRKADRLRPAHEGVCDGTDAPPRRQRALQ